MTEKELFSEIITETIVLTDTAPNTLADALTTSTGGLVKFEYRQDGSWTAEGELPTGPKPNEIWYTTANNDKFDIAALMETMAIEEGDEGEPFQIANRVVKDEVSDDGTYRIMTFENNIARVGIDYENNKIYPSFSDTTEYPEILTDDVTSILLPLEAEMTVVDSFAFWHCTKLKKILLPDEIVTLNEGAFTNCEALESVVLPRSLKYIGESCFETCKSLISLELPEEMEEIDVLAFADCESLETITVPDSVNRIGAKAFYQCVNLAGVNLKNTAVKNIEKSTFYLCGNADTVIQLPANLETIGDYAFEAARITSLELPTGCLELIGEGAFSYTNIDSIAIPASVTTIGACAFYGSSFTTIDIPANSQLTTLGELAFWDSNITSVTIPASVTTIGSGICMGCENLVAAEISAPLQTLGDYWFSGCTNLTEITLPTTLKSTGTGTFGDCNGIQSLDFLPNGLQTIGEGSFYDCTGLQSIDNIPGSVATISNFAFAGCTALTSVTIPATITSIGESSFARCSGLLLMIVLAPVTTIPEDMLSSCTSLTSFTMPETVTSMGAGALENCTSLAKIKSLPVNPPTLQSDTLTGVPANCVIKVPFGSANTYKANPNWLSRTDYIEEIIPTNEIWYKSTDGNEINQFKIAANFGSNITFVSDSVSGDYRITKYSGNATKIGDNAFSGVTTLADIIIPDGVTSIGSSAFERCSGLTNIDIPDGVTSIGYYAFLGCTNLTDITLPDELASIGRSAFESCSGLTGITIPTRVTSIGGRVFWGCSSLTGFTIPDSVTNIGELAFYHCSSLTDINIPTGVTSIGESVFGYCSNLTGITVDPNNLAYDSRDNCNAIIRTATNKLIAGCKNTIIPGSITSIGNSAFYQSVFTSIVIPNSVASIGNSAFYNCYMLRQVTVLGTDPATLGTNVFLSAASGFKIYVPFGRVDAYKNAWADYKDRIFESDPVPTTNEIWYKSTDGTEIDQFKTAANFGNNITFVSDSVSGDYRVAKYSGDVTKIADKTFSGVTTLAEIVIPSGVTSIGDSAFYNCSSLTSITIPSGVTSIRNYAFGDCTSLTGIAIPDSVTSIGGSVFQGCTSLTGITLPDSVTSIGGSAFQGCTSLTGITLPTGVTSIRYQAFYGCSNLTGIFIPSGVASIEKRVFGLCSKLTSITVDPNNPVYDSRDNCNVIIKTSTNELVAGCKSAIIPNSVTSIGDEAFYQYAGGSIDIPDSVTSIGNRAFYNCIDLRQVTVLGTTPPILGTNVFWYVANDFKIYVPADSVDTYRGTAGWSDYASKINPIP